MTGTNESSLGLLVDNGLLSLVCADKDLLVTSSQGHAALAIPLGNSLCEAVPALFGLDEDIQALRDAPGDRIQLTNIAVVGSDGPSERLDYVVVFDGKTDGFLLSITPSLANDELSVELEQNLRQKLHLEMRVAAQARAIDETNAALKRTNADLINFTRIISHDLKAPMRAIRYSAEDITATLSDADDPLQIQALDELRQQSVRLSQMVTDLLTYSRLDDKTLAAASVDTHAMINAIAESLPRPEGLQLEISGQWPEITTIGVLLDIVLRNLLDNAIKHHDRNEGQITITAKMTEKHLTVIVSDDGPGIPQDYRKAVLQPFTKVDHASGESSGLGLSMVDKVMKNVGGRLDIGSGPDGRRGARISVLWPLTIVAV